jgi:hypothetical protein
MEELHGRPEAEEVVAGIEAGGRLRVQRLAVRFGPATFNTARLAPGAIPSILMLQPGGSGCAGLTNPDRS